MPLALQISFSFQQRGIPLAHCGDIRFAYCLKLIVKRLVSRQGFFVRGLDAPLDPRQRKIHFSLKFSPGGFQAKHVRMIVAQCLEKSGQLHIRVVQRASQSRDFLVPHEKTQGLHELFALQILDLIKTRFTGNHFHAGLDAVALQLGKPYLVHPHGTRARTHGGHIQGPSKLIDGILRRFDFFPLFEYLRAHRVQSAIHLAPLEGQPVVRINLRHLIGNLGRLVGVLSSGTDHNQCGVSVLIHGNRVKQNSKRLFVGNAPFLPPLGKLHREIKIRHHLIHDGAGLDDFILCAQKKWIVHLGGVFSAEHGYIRNIAPHRNARGRAIHLGEIQGVNHACNHDEQHDRKDDFLASTDYPPVIQHVQSRIRRLCLFHRLPS